MSRIKLIVEVDEETVKKGFDGPLTDEERQSLLRAFGNAKQFDASGDSISRSWVEHNILSLVDPETRFYAKQRLDDAPPVPERPKGKWKFYEEDPDDDCMAYYKCSECGRLIHTAESGLLKNYPYCHCGADMRKGGAE